MIVVFTGEGKGKSSAAIGMIVRALGWNKKVAVIVFLKGWWKSGERKMLEKLSNSNSDLRIKYFTIKEWVKSAEPKNEKIAQAALAEVTRAIDEKPFLVVVDELITAYALKLIRISDIRSIINNARAKKTHLVLTGRGWPKSLNSEVDIVSDIQKVVHCFDQGKLAEKGLDW